jgi:hypothetical protein
MQAAMIIDPLSLLLIVADTFLLFWVTFGPPDVPAEPTPPRMVRDGENHWKMK